ncbi:MAG: phosphoglucosamine mutase [Betaproteobacteria bacterium]|nr:phosphoglucosamine mutase [Betaproteobacteria bacterium]
MKRKYFGTDGIRGRVGDAPITPDIMLRLGYAAGRVLTRQQEHPAVVIGKDTRISGYMLESALEAGLSAAGCDVYLTGPMSTPGVAFLTRALRLSAGIMISASHNPFEDNGIKFFSAEGAKLPDEVELDIEAALDEPLATQPSTKLGKAMRVHDAEGRYIEFCKGTFPKEQTLRGLKLVVDAAHGACYRLAPRVFQELGAQVVPIGVAPNGLNINDRCGATHAEAMAHAVTDNEADFGIALDGDGDRLMMADADGTLFDGDQLLYVIVKDQLSRGARSGVVGTLMTNLAVELAFAKLGASFARAKVGDRHVLEMLNEKGWLWGGENSGHIICLDRHTTGDGIVSALQVLAALKRAGQSLGEYSQELTLFPQVLVNVRTVTKLDFAGNSAIQHAVRAAESELNGAGRVLLRASGTEPVIRVMVEGRDAAQVSRLAETIASEVRRAA